MNKTILYISVLLLAYLPSVAQEGVQPLRSNSLLKNNTMRSSTERTAIMNTLPFFEEFVQESILPNPNKWQDQLVYINNHLAKEPISRGVATFDALNMHGTPYDTTNRNVSVYADTLTSNSFDLSSYNIGDSLYLSFFYQVQGLGFRPYTEDSLMLYFKDNNLVWRKIWSTNRDNAIDFTQKFILVNDASFFHDEFEFRFINKATKGITNSDFHLDYIEFDANRSELLPEVNDIAITVGSTSIFSPYQSLPYEYFALNPSAYLRPNLNLSVRNTTQNDENINYGYQLLNGNNILAQQSINGTSLYNYVETYSLPGIAPGVITGPSQPNNLTLKYFTSDPINATRKANDTLIAKQLFSNQLAYDDGTAELSYFVFMHPSLAIPALSAISYTIPKKDTIRGFGVLLTQEVPIPRSKEFTIKVFKEIAFNGGNDIEIYNQEMIYPEFSDSLNGLFYYKFTEPVIVDAGTFYLSIVQPAGGYSDSLFIALDRSTEDEANHRYYNVIGSWERSEIGGALLFRPVMGGDFSLNIDDISNHKQSILIYPNPTTDRVQIEEAWRVDEYELLDISGRMLRKGIVEKQQIELGGTPSGSYLLLLKHRKMAYPAQKIIIK